MTTTTADAPYRFEPDGRLGVTWAAVTPDGTRAGTVTVAARGLVVAVEQADQPQHAHLRTLVADDAGPIFLPALTLPWGETEDRTTGPRGGNPVSPDAARRARGVLEVFLADPDAEARQITGRARLVAELGALYQEIDRAAAARIRALIELRDDLGLGLAGFASGAALDLTTSLPTLEEVEDHPAMPVTGKR